MWFAIGFLLCLWSAVWGRLCIQFGGLSQECRNQGGDNPFKLVCSGQIKSYSSQMPIFMDNSLKASILETWRKAQIHPELRTDALLRGLNDCKDCVFESKTLHGLGKRLKMLCDRSDAAFVLTVGSLLLTVDIFAYILLLEAFGLRVPLDRKLLHYLTLFVRINYV